MILRSVLALSLVSLAGSLHAADEGTTSSAMRQMLREKIAEEAGHGPAKPTAASAAAAPSPSPTPAVAAGPVAPSALPDSNPLLSGTGQAAEARDSQDGDKKSETTAAAPTVLPNVQVTTGRITKLDQELAKEDELIAREKKNTKASEVDKALNDVKIAKPLAIFGGESAQYREQVSSQRVSLMEDEKDMIEAIAHAKTKAEKAELQKQLDALREERRLLEEANR